MLLVFFFVVWHCFATRSLAEIERWLSELSKELVLRLDEQRETEGQIPSKLTVSFAEVQKVIWCN